MYLFWYKSIWIYETLNEEKHLVGSETTRVAPKL